MFLVADGMGGRGGEASQTIVDVLSSWWDNDLPTILSLPFEMEMVLSSLDSTIAVANSNVLALHPQNPIVSTLSLLMVMGKKYAIRHVGDSRIYLINDAICQLTPDHIIETEPMRTVLAKCIGAKKVVSLFNLVGESKPGDMFLLCTDGMYRQVTDEMILATVLNCSIAIEEKANALRNAIPPGKAYDNVSIILVGDM